jgi:ABC-type uncharacterized transport system involved in gliding motility auxiliary subunit
MGSGVLGWLGLVAIVFGLLSLLLQLLSGGLFLAVDLPWIWANFAIGLGLLGFALFTNLDTLRERLRSGEARRAGKYGSSAILATALSIALLALLAFLSTRYSARWDWTETGVHSLSDQSTKVLEGLEQDVKVTAFYSAVAAAPVKALLDRYGHASPRFQVEFVDPQARPGVSRGLGIPDEKLSGGLVHVALGAESVQVDEPSEDKVTNALLTLTRRDQKKVYFLTGHNERALAGETGQGKEGMSFAKEALENERYQVEELLLAAKGDVPADADVVVVAGATRPLHETEHQALDRYVKRGGALLVLLDPRAQTDLYASLEGWGVSVGDDVIVDRVQGLFGRAASPFAAEYAAHPITRDLREATLFHVARSVTPKDPTGGFTALAKTSPESWGERDVDLFFQRGRAELGGDDLRGPVSVAVAGSVAADGAATPGEEQAGEPAGEGGEEPKPEAEAARKEARLVVFGDSDFATNQLLLEFRNRDLFLNSVNWLLGDVEAISIRPNQARASRLELSQEQFLQIRYLSLFVLPEAIAVLGVLAWWSRRRAPGR